MSETATLSMAEIDVLVEGLAKLEPGILPFKLFHEIARVIATPIIEVVPIRQARDGRPEILLVRREADDPVWPSQLHVPGTVIRASDAEGSFKDAFGRVSTELGGIAVKDPVLVKNIIHHSGRGMEVSQLYWIDLGSTEPAIGEFFAADNLPEDIVRSQLDFLPDVVAHYIATQTRE